MPTKSIATGRRGYQQYLYGTHFWVPETQTDWSAGIFRDVARPDIPANGLYDALDFLVHQPGVAFKRGGTAYSGPAMTGASYAQAVAYASFPAGIGAQLLALGENGHLFKITSGTTTDLGSGVPVTVDRPKLFVGGAQNIVVFTDPSGTGAPWYYDGSNAPKSFEGSGAAMVLTITGTPTSGTFKLRTTYLAGSVSTTKTTATIAYNASAANVASALNLLTGSGTWAASGGPLPGSTVTITRPLLNTGGTPNSLSLTSVSLSGGSSPTAALTPSGAVTDIPTAIYSETHLSRLVLANTTDNPNRLFFSPVLSITSTAWDATSYFDFPRPISGMRSLAGILLVFSQDAMYRLVGDTPPPGTNMSLAPVATVGCSDARSIIVFEGQCIFANPRGVYATTGVAPVPLMKERIETYWQSLFTSYDPTTWVISSGLYAGRFLVVALLNASRVVQTCLMCDLARNAWVRLSAPRAMMFANAYGVKAELYAASGGTNRVESCSGFFLPTSSNKNDADGTAVTCLLETRPFGGGPGVSAFGQGHLTYDMRDAASDNPTLAVTVAPGIEATTYAAVAESPLAETSDSTRTRYATGKQSQALSVKFTQANASSLTEIFSVEQNTRAFPRGGGGQ